MKKTKILVALAMVTALFSCSKKDAPILEPDNENDVITLSIEQPTDEASTKTVLGDYDETNKNYPINWSNSDEIAVCGQEASSYAAYVLDEGDGTTKGKFIRISGSGEKPEGAVYAYYPRENVTAVSSGEYTVSIPFEQGYVSNSFGKGAMPMFAAESSTSSLSTMTSLMSVLKINLKGTCKVKSILLESETDDVYLSGTATISNGTLSFTQGLKYVLLDCGDGVQLSEDSGTDFHFVVPATNDKVTFKFTIKDDSGYIMQTRFTTANNFKAKVIKKISKTLTVSTSARLPGRFSVDEEGSLVRFSCGNLRAKKDNGTWSWGFYENQYQFNSLQSTSSSGRTATSDDTEIDLFCWGYDATGSLNPIETTTRATFTDWSTISTLPSGAWTTLSKDEWFYLITTRKVNGGSGSGNTFFPIKLSLSNGSKVFGLILYPDNYTGTTSLASYDLAWGDWLVMESAGCVFLPAAGCRLSGIQIYGVSYFNSSDYEGTCEYWSGTGFIYPQTGKIEDSDIAYCLYYNSSTGLEEEYPQDKRSKGCSVRLVTRVGS